MRNKDVVSRLAVSLLWDTEEAVAFGGEFKQTVDINRVTREDDFFLLTFWTLFLKAFIGILALLRSVSSILRLRGAFEGAFCCFTRCGFLFWSDSGVAFLIGFEERKLSFLFIWNIF